MATYLVGDRKIEERVMSDVITVCRSTRLTPAAYRFYREVLLSFAERGGAPDQADLRGLAARFGVPLAATLADLAAKGLLQRDPATVPSCWPSRSLACRRRIV
jgi:hypothetical protein